MPFTTFLFDLDGTIIDSIELILRSYRHTMQLHRCNDPMPPDQTWIQGLGTPLWVQFGQITEDKAEIEAMVATYRAYNLTHHDALVKPYQGIAEEIRHLKDNGKRLGLVTSKLRDGAMRGIRIAGLDQAFDIIVGCDDVKQFKPHPEPVLKAVDELGVEKEETVFVGDSRHDMECGRAAGVKTAAVLWGPFDRSHLADLEPDYWLEKPSDLRILAADTLTPDT
jgi:pyrophosphatase PpaX